MHDYPASIKPFYMRLNEPDAEGRSTVRAMDVLAPRVGEIVGGSQREEREDVLVERMRAQGIDPRSLWWYVELRTFGSVPHAGFGLGLERLVQLATGMQNVRDVIPFPRTPGHAEFLRTAAGSPPFPPAGPGFAEPPPSTPAEGRAPGR